MPSPEGHGNARKAWDAYSRTVKTLAEPVVTPFAFWVAGRIVEDLSGFWLLWHLEGGYEGLERLGMSRSAIYRRINSFRKHFGVHPDDFRFPGVTLDVAAYQAVSREKAAATPS
jgi:hypothetical protein